MQTGETDATRDAPDRKFYVSDLIRAYHRNIPGGVDDLFSHVVALDMSDIPGSVLQRYALENKEPIYVDRSRVHALGFGSVEARIFSGEQLRLRGVIQHDPDALAWAVKGLWALHQAGFLDQPERKETLPEPDREAPRHPGERPPPCQRYEAIRARLHYLATDRLPADGRATVAMMEPARRRLIERMIEILWLHPDIPPAHLEFVRGVTLVEPAAWRRCQEWDNIFSFYDPVDRHIKIRQDQADSLGRFEMVFLVALGQSLLGNYAEDKQMAELRADGDTVGRVYRLRVRDSGELASYLDPAAIDAYLRLSRMRPSATEERLYTRVVNPDEGFTPPGLFFGLFYAWYLDNVFAPNIEYKMSIMRNRVTDLIPEQARIVGRRRDTIRFFRERVFRQRVPQFSEKLP